MHKFLPTQLSLSLLSPHIANSFVCFTVSARELADVYKSHPVNLHKQQPDDFNSLHELPDDYAWASQINEYPSLDSSSCSETVPIIDLTDPNALELIVHACSYIPSLKPWCPTETCG